MVGAKPETGSTQALGSRGGRDLGSADNTVSSVGWGVLPGFGFLEVRPVLADDRETFKCGFFAVETGGLRLVVFGALADGGVSPAMAGNA